MNDRSAHGEAKSEQALRNMQRIADMQADETNQSQIQEQPQVHSMTAEKHQHTIVTKLDQRESMSDQLDTLPADRDQE